MDSRRAGTSARRTGNSGGDRYCEILSESDRVGEGGPQMWGSVPDPERREEPEPLEVIEVQVAEEESMRSAPSVQHAPSARMPVPESRMTRRPSSVHTSTQEVFPPVRTVSGPGDANEPREPQNLARTSSLPGRLPEDGEAADELVLLSEQGHGHDLEIVRLSIHGLDPGYPWLGTPSRNAAASGRSASAIGSPDASTGLNVFASSTRLIWASA